jgi:uncharacterized phage-associated protein
MASVLDVAAYILKKCGPQSAMKLQKLVYYTQAWSTVWLDRPLFSDRIEAWANGPVCPALYQLHRGEFMVEAKNSLDRSPVLSPEETKTIDSVLDFYGGKPSQWLSDLTHSESPWMDARAGLSPGERGEKEITPAAMHEYYSSL